MKEKKPLTRDEWIVLFLGVTFLFGIIARFFPGFLTGFPLNDGGMFMIMIRDLRASHYAIPATTAYNNLGIPYAYPLFGFYFARLFSDIFRVSEVEALRWIPPAVNALTIWAFYALASDLLESRRRGVIAAAFFALTPGLSAWFIMGGGLTRGFGVLFMALSMGQVYRLFRDGGNKALILSIVFCSLAVLSHPGIGMQTAGVCILLWLFYGRSRRSTLYAMAIGAATLALSSVWWGNVLARHGMEPFLSALHTGNYGVSKWMALISSIFSDEAIIPIAVALRVIGLIWGAWKRKYFLLAWVALPYIVEPRDGQHLVYYPLCMLMALAYADALPAIVDFLRKKKSEMEFHARGWVTGSLLLLMTYLFVESCLYGFRLMNTSLTEADRGAMTWIQQNTPADAHFLPITGIPNAEIDPFVEWFPALTERRSQLTIQGYEWTLGPKFYDMYYSFAEAQGCASVSCLEEWSARTGLDYQYIVVRRFETDAQLLDSLNKSSRYEKAYSSDLVVVYYLKGQ